MSKFIITLIIYIIGITSAAEIMIEFPIDVNKFIWQKPENLTQPEWLTEEVKGYHFHVYFFQDNPNSQRQAMNLRLKIKELIISGPLSGCRLNVIFTQPQGPHPIGNFETCCNATALSSSLEWFMQNHGNLSVLLHPSTRWALEDHTTKAMWLGPVLPLDLSTLPWDMSDELRCDPIDLPNEQSFYDEL